MKNLIYTIALVLVSGGTIQAQTPIKQTKEELADFMLLNNNLIVFTLKGEKGQFIYTEKRGQKRGPKKELALNAGAVNAVIGRNSITNELYVYHKNGPKVENISFYALKNSGFKKTGKRAMPRMRNHSPNLGLFLSEDKNMLLISAELGKSQGYDDIYLSRWEGNHWSKPVSLGKTVNTREAEFAPFVANDSLYFSRKESGGTYAYGVPFKEGKLIGEPVKIRPVINKSGAYNAYYKTVDERQMWLSASTEKPGYTAYVLEKLPPVEEEVVAPIAEVEDKKVVKTRSTEPELVLYYDIGYINILSEEARALAEFLSWQPEGASIIIKGYSDGFGTLKIRESVSRRRAQRVKQYIDEHFSDKRFELTLENDIIEAKGRENRKTEFYIFK
jgi:outer membrane protein OmpA-like peptidoglycan-associated protein